MDLYLMQIYLKIFYHMVACYRFKMFWRIRFLSVFINMYAWNPKIVWGQVSTSLPSCNHNYNRVIKTVCSPPLPLSYTRTSSEIPADKFQPGSACIGNGSKAICQRNSLYNQQLMAKFTKLSGCIFFPTNHAACENDKIQQWGTFWVKQLQKSGFH